MQTPPKKAKNFLSTRSTRHSTVNKSPIPMENTASEELITFLESRLETHENTIQKKKGEYD